ncbi:protoporphyrinogen oxidase [Tribolium castaneum]|uniref:Protoporphyrinogen oxidase n=1 Tax=Tribolium castaneum TaxID=7070 RepID=D6W9X5_TRICA|nr:PREDICTED: protoporphyrinogen oxidase [Tribolium castaneum]EEZ98095.1 Protoporphyrinogen oxidase-like Protein [Tribolium castaneum]|eukprot:XP_975249.1 PREDICTED: protoporphyrinogen oxidase [Tribolium castaneum]
MSKVILGGGLGGLSAAYYLKKFSPNQAVTLIESSSRTGGWIKSSVQENGAIFEQGPRTIRPRGDAGANTLQLIEELNLSDQIVPITSGHPAAKNRLIYANGSLHLLPSSLTGLFRKQEPFSKPLILHLLNDLKARRKEVKDESIYDFIGRRFGSEVADYLISPLICGICAGNAKEISVKFLMKQLFEYEQKHGSVSKGLLTSLFAKSKRPTVLCETALRARSEKWNIYSFKNGCETLPIALRNNIVSNGVNIKFNTECTEIITDKGQVILNLFNNETIKCDHLVGAIPANVLGRLLQKQHPELAQCLKKLTKNVSVAVVNLLFKENFIKNPAFGLLVVPKEQLPVLGVIYDSCCFPVENCGTVLTVMMGGYWFEEHFGTNPQENVLLDVAVKHVKRILNCDHDPFNYKVNILKQCLPQYVVGHDENLDLINGYIRTHKLPISLCGASYYGVGINDVILSAKNAVKDL